MIYKNLNTLRTRYKLFIVLLFIISTSLLSACGIFDKPSSPTITPPKEPTNTPAPTEPDIGTIPKIDVVIIEVKLPARVTHETEFEYTIVVNNSSPDALSAGVVNVDIRANFNDSINAIDIRLGSTVFRNLKPNEPQEKVLMGIAPNRPGIWTVYATVDPFDFIDTINNRLEAPLIVD